MRQQSSAWRIANSANASESPLRAARASVRSTCASTVRYTRNARAFIPNAVEGTKTAPATRGLIAEQCADRVRSRTSGNDAACRGLCVVSAELAFTAQPLGRLRDSTSSPLQSRGRQRLRLETACPRGSDYTRPMLRCAMAPGGDRCAPLEKTLQATHSFARSLMGKKASHETYMHLGARISSWPIVPPQPASSAVGFGWRRVERGQAFPRPGGVLRRERRGRPGRLLRRPRGGSWDLARERSVDTGARRRGLGGGSACDRARDRSSFEHSAAGACAAARDPGRARRPRLRRAVHGGAGTASRRGVRSRVRGAEERESAARARLRGCPRCDPARPRVCLAGVARLPRVGGVRDAARPRWRRPRGGGWVRRGGVSPSHEPRAGPAPAYPCRRRESDAEPRRGVACARRGGDLADAPPRCGIPIPIPPALRVVARARRDVDDDPHRAGGARERAVRGGCGVLAAPRTGRRAPRGDRRRRLARRTSRRA